MLEELPVKQMFDSWDPDSTLLEALIRPIHTHHRPQLQNQIRMPLPAKQVRNLEGLWNASMFLCANLCCPYDTSTYILDEIWQIEHKT